MTPDTDRIDAYCAEFERQADRLRQRGYPALAGMTERAFRQNIEPLGARVAELAESDASTDPDRIPFVIVYRSDALAREAAMGRVDRKGKQGFTVLEPDDLRRFEPIKALALPAAPAYLLADIDTGMGTRNVTPDDALSGFRESGRTPLTVDEGIALVTHFPDTIRKGHGYSLLGSRCGDRRVCALWISDGRPKLGWCWAGNPHTWLGSASAAGRIGP